MLLSAAEKDSGIIPGAQPIGFRVHPQAYRQLRRAHEIRRHQLGDIAPVDITPPIDLSTGTFTAPTSSFDPSSLFVTVTPSVFDTSPVPSLPAFVTPSAPDIPPPSFQIAPDASGPGASVAPTVAAPGTTPVASGPDYFGDILKLAQIAGQTFVGVTAAQHGLPPGVSSGVYPGQPVGAGPLTAAQLAMMTPAQRAQYATMYPGTGAASPGDFLSTILGTGQGGPSLTTIMLWGGAGLLAFVLLTRKQGKA